MHIKLFRERDSPKMLSTEFYLKYNQKKKKKENDKAQFVQYL